MSEEQAGCVWCEDEDGDWMSKCGLYFCFEDRSPKCNGWNFCPKCGNPLTECAYDPKEECDHSEGSEGGICDACGADITQELVMAAEAAADAREDR